MDNVPPSVLVMNSGGQQHFCPNFYFLYFYQESDNPESAVAGLFASAKKNSVQFNNYHAISHCLQILPSEGQMRVLIHTSPILKQIHDNGIEIRVVH